MKKIFLLLRLYSLKKKTITCKDRVLREYLYSIPHSCLGHCDLKACVNKLTSFV